MENKQTIIVSGILEKEGKVFLARRPLSKKIAPGLYHLPGGHVEFGEHPGQALVREFQEEFKLSIQTEDLMRAFSYQNDEIHTIGITYQVISDGDLDDIWFDPKDNEELVWVGRDDLHKFFSSHDHDYLTLLKFFAQHE